MGGVCAERLRLMVRTFRRQCHRLLQSERTTVHGADGMLMLLQLAMAQVNQQRGGNFTVPLSDVLMAWKHLLLDKLHLPPPSSAHLEDYDLILQAYQSLLKRSNAVDLVDVLCMYRQLRGGGSDAEQPVTPVTPIQLFEFLSGNMEASDSPGASDPSPASGQVCSSQVKMAVRRVFYAYLTLLVNAKNDLALAMTLDVPSRALGRQAFTDVKHAACNANTSLFLAVTSFVRAIQLGGKGYAPAPCDPLRKHVKGLSDFVQFMDALDEILGETPDPSACGTKLVAAIRAALVRGRGGGDAVHAAAEETAEELKEKIHQMHQVQKQTAGGSGSGISPARPKAHAINHATAYGGRDTVKVLMALLDQEALTPPSRNKAELLSEEQPLLAGAEGPTCVLTLFRSPEVSTGCSPQPLRSRVQSRLDLLKPKVRVGVIRSQFACTYRDDELPLNRMLDFPSTSQVPTCVHPAPKPRTTQIQDQDQDRECRSGVESRATGTDLTLLPGSHSELGAKPPPGRPDGQRIGQQGAALQVRAGNQQTAGGRQRQSRGHKRKQADGDQHGGCENTPPKKKRATVKNVSKRKLIAGQRKLTSFFRV